MKVIFLDLDGVLNTCHSAKKSEVPVLFEGIEIGFNQLDEICVATLNYIIDKTDAKLVISSTWRILVAKHYRFEALINHLKNQGVIGEIIGYTPIRKDFNRNKEINKWIHQNKELLNIEKYVILDDDLGFFNDKVPSNFVYIENGWVTGLQLEHANEAIKILNNKEDEQQ